jgi:hypothetical protein
MDIAFVQYSNFELQIREVMNIGITIHSPVLAVLFVYYVISKWREIGGCLWNVERQIGADTSTWRKRFKNFIWSCNQTIWATYRSYKRVDKPIRGLVGMTCFLIGEGIRTAATWHVLHTDGARANYLSDISILLVSLFLIIAGLSCAVRNFTPHNPRCLSGHRLWLYCLYLYVLVSIVNFTILE